MHEAHYLDARFTLTEKKKLKKLIENFAGAKFLDKMESSCLLCKSCCWFPSPRFFL